MERAKSAPKAKSAPMSWRPIWQMLACCEFDFVIVKSVKLLFFSRGFHVSTQIKEDINKSFCVLWFDKAMISPVQHNKRVDRKTLYSRFSGQLFHTSMSVHKDNFELTEVCTKNKK